jgi:hypothetical protein
MPNALVDGLSLVDTTGHVILGCTVAALLLGVLLNLFIRAGYARLEFDLRRNGDAKQPFSHRVLNGIVADVEAASRTSNEPNVQAIIEDHVQTDLRTLLLAERFVKAATGLVIILGLLGTFYGLALSIGRLVHLVSADAPAVSDVTQTVGKGLTQALSGMAVAFSNSLFGITSAVVLTVLGIFSNVTDRRIAFMIRVETYFERRMSETRPRVETSSPNGRRPGPQASHGIDGTVAGFGESVARLEDAVARFEASLQAFAGSAREFREFNSHLKDNIQRMSLSFGDFSEALRSQIVALRSADRN